MARDLKVSISAGTLPICRVKLIVSLNGHNDLRFPTLEPLSLLAAQLLGLQHDDELLKRAGKRKWHLVYVILNDRGASVFADVESLVERETDRRGLWNMTLRNLLSINEKSPGRPSAQSTTFVLEVDSKDVIARRKRLV